MKSSLLATALVLAFSTSAFAAPTKATDEQSKLIQRATVERVSKIVEGLKEKSQQTRDLIAPNCQMVDPTLASYGMIFIDASEALSTIQHASEVWVDQGAQPVLTFVLYPLASRAGETRKTVRVVSDSTDTTILGISSDTTRFQEVLGGSVSNPSYSVQGVTETKNCSFKTMKKPEEPKPAPAPVKKKTTKAPVLK